MSRPFELTGFDHIGFIVGNAKQASYYYESIYGFSLTAYSGLETGQREQASYVLTQNDVNFVFTTPLSSDSPLNEHLRQHGDGVKNIAFGVDDATKAWEYTTSQGAASA